MRNLTIENIKAIIESVEAKYIIFTEPNGYSVAANIAFLKHTFTLPFYANNKKTDRTITNYVSYRECSFQEYISKKVGFI
jgi:hypothetical protein